MVLSKKALEEMGAAEFGLNPIGTGPYEFVEWKPNDVLILKRFEDYWGEKPEWDEIHIFAIPEDAAAEIALETGDVDFGRVAPESFTRFEDNPNFTTYPMSGLDYEWLNVNVVHPKLQDKNVRLAIRYGIDPQEIIDAAHGGLWQRACAMIAPGQVGYWADAPCYERDVEKAKGYLAAAGLDSLDLTLTISQGEEEVTAAQVVQAQLAEVGINIEIVPVDDATFNTLGDQVRDRELTLVGYSTNPDPSWSVVWHLCDQVDQWNWTYYCNEEVDSLAAQAVTELDPAKRTELYIQLQKIWDEDAVAWDWIAFRSYFFVARAGIVPAIQGNGRWLAYAFTSE
jgi:peptide/nickel transport system substrate-binding protein